MSKLFIVLIALYGVILLLSFAGIHTGEEGFLSNFDLLSNSSSSGFWKDVVASGVGVGALIALCVVTSLGVAILTKTSPDIYISASIAAVAVLPWVSTFKGLIEFVEGAYSPWVYYITWVVFGIMGLMYLASAVDWILNRGSN